MNEFSVNQIMSNYDSLVIGVKKDTNKNENQSKKKKTYIQMKSVHKKDIFK